MEKFNIDSKEYEQNLLQIKFNFLEGNVKIEDFDFFEDKPELNKIPVKVDDFNININSNLKTGKINVYTNTHGLVGQIDYIILVDKDYIEITFVKEDRKGKYYNPITYKIPKGTREKTIELNFTNKSKSTTSKTHEFDIFLKFKLIIDGS